MKTQIVINENPNPWRPNLRGMKMETVEEFLARGGQITKVASFQETWFKWVRRELLEEMEQTI